MGSLKIGDVVVCVNNNGLADKLELSRLYVVDDIFPEKMIRNKETDTEEMWSTIDITDFTGNITNYNVMIKRFKKARLYPDTKLYRRLYPNAKLYKGKIIGG